MKLITRLKDYFHYRKQGYAKAKAWDLAGSTFYWYQRGYHQ